MNTRRPGKHRGRSLDGFTLVELLVVIAIIGLLVSILLPALAAARRSGRKAVCMSNLHQFAVGYSGYALDAGDRIATFSWKAGGMYSQYSDLNPVPSTFGSNANPDTGAGIYQMADICRRRSGRNDLQPLVYLQWTPHPRFSHVVMNDYFAQRLPEPMVVCPENAAVLEFQRLSRNPATATSGDDIGWRSAYASSYMMVPCGYSPNKKARGVNQFTAGPTKENNRSFRDPVLPLGRKLADVAYPAQKVLLMDEIARHGSKPDYYAYADTSQPLLFFDFSVRDVRAGDTNPGADPNDSSTLPFEVSYVPDARAQDPPARNPRADGSSDPIIVRYQWTRGGLSGVDVGGGNIK